MFIVRIFAHTATGQWNVVQGGGGKHTKKGVDVDGNPQTDTALWNLLLEVYGDAISPKKVELTVLDAMAYEEYLIVCEETDEEFSVSQMMKDIFDIWPYQTKLLGLQFMNGALLAGECPFCGEVTRFQVSFRESNGSLNKQYCGRHFRRIHKPHVVWAKYVYCLFIRCLVFVYCVVKVCLQYD